MPHLPSLPSRFHHLHPSRLVCTDHLPLLPCRTLPEPISFQPSLHRPISCPPPKHPDLFIAPPVSQVVVLVPSEPTPAFRELLMTHSHSQRVQYLRGDLLSQVDLARARVDVAIGCFILADKQSLEPDMADAMSVLRAVSAHNHRPSMRTIVQLIKPKHKQYLTSMGISEDNIVCINQLRMRIAAQGCLVPGFATLFSNLITSLSAEKVTGWVGNYLHGLDQESYAEQIPAWFVGHRFSDVSRAIYQRFGVLLIAVVLHDYFQVVLNPGKGFKLRRGDVGLFLTSNAQQVDKMLSECIPVRVSSYVNDKEAGSQTTSLHRQGIGRRSASWDRRCTFPLRERSCLRGRRRPTSSHARQIPDFRAAKEGKGGRRHGSELNPVSECVASALRAESSLGGGEREEGGAMDQDEAMTASPLARAVGRLTFSGRADQEASIESNCGANQSVGQPRSASPFLLRRDGDVHHHSSPQADTSLKGDSLGSLDGRLSALRAHSEDMISIA
ncbi:MAG: hypothetical protein SGPRY_007036, partial [Prymnesium sp.]